MYIDQIAMELFSFMEIFFSSITNNKLDYS
jgi:hypothetical protein